MPLKPHPTDPDKAVYERRQYDLPKREWQGLTDEEIGQAARDAHIAFCLGKHHTYEHALTRAIEAKIKEKNT